MSSRNQQLKRYYGITEKQWWNICDFFGNQCLRCHVSFGPDKLTVDHIDGNNRNSRIENYQPLCLPCNSWKGKRAIDFRPEGKKGRELRIFLAAGVKQLALNLDIESSERKLYFLQWDLLQYSFDNNYRVNKSYLDKLLSDEILRPKPEWFVKPEYYHKAQDDYKKILYNYDRLLYQFKKKPDKFYVSHNVNEPGFDFSFYPESHALGLKKEWYQLLGDSSSIDRLDKTIQLDQLEYQIKQNIPQDQWWKFWSYNVGLVHQAYKRELSKPTILGTECTAYSCLDEKGKWIITSIPYSQLTTLSELKKEVKKQCLSSDN